MFISFDVSQGSIIGILLFNKLLYGMFFFSNNVTLASHADDDTPCYIENFSKEVMKNKRELPFKE